MRSERRRCEAEELEQRSRGIATSRSTADDNEATPSAAAHLRKQRTLLATKTSKHEKCSTTLHSMLYFATQRQDKPYKPRARSSTGRASDYGSEGWRFESSRAYLETRGLAASGAFLRFADRANDRRGGATRSEQRRRGPSHVEQRRQRQRSPAERSSSNSEVISLQLLRTTTQDLFVRLQPRRGDLSIATGFSPW